MKKTPTIRSEFSFAQFEERLQAFAYKAACDIVNKPPKEGEIKVIMDGTQVSRIETPVWSVRFFSKHATVERNERVRADWGNHHYYNSCAWGFSVEDKEYTDSNHRSKLSFFGKDMTQQVKVKEKSPYSDDEYDTTKAVIVPEKVADIKKTVFDFIAKLMEGMKAEPRFKLQQVHA